MLTTIKRERKAALFIRELARNGGFVNKACEVVKVSKQTVYNWRQSDPEFAQQWEDSIECAIEDLEAEARRRAYEGIDEPVFYQGEQCGVIRKYSDTLLIFKLKALKPEKYRENINISVPDLDAAIERQLARLAAGSQAEVSGEANSESVH